LFSEAARKTRLAIEMEAFIKVHELYESASSFFDLIKIFSIEIENSDLGLGHSPILFSRNFFVLIQNPKKEKKKKKTQNPMKEELSILVGA
jgi:hypothetical protein